MNKKLIILVIVLMAIFSSGCLTTGTGSSTDTIYGTEYNGIPWKTYSVWLTHDIPTGTGKNSYSAIYTVDNGDTQLIQQVEDTYKSGKQVKIYYKNEMFYEPWKYTHNAVAVITKIEYV
jgi:hypothetical protein